MEVIKILIIPRAKALGGSNLILMKPKGFQPLECFKVKIETLKPPIKIKPRALPLEVLKEDLNLIKPLQGPLALGFKKI